MILAERDSIVDPEPCLAEARAIERSGGRSSVAIIPGADHGFDQQEKTFLSTLVFDPAQRNAALAHVRDFLSTLGGR